MKSFRELDEAAGATKGTAFRIFKQLEPQLAEGRDFRLLRPGRDDSEIDRLRQARRIYASSVNVVLVSDEVAGDIARQLPNLMQKD